jgi:hypothetical protein
MVKKKKLIDMNEKKKNHPFFVQVLHFLIVVCPHNLNSCLHFISPSTNFRKQGQKYVRTW